ncbi:undecaprenyl-diphosphate phosphatase [Saprospiraceae bacterium]|nr:undecaprenyl-diphosphate phosphatase [Saprospiraceae bacterium]
MMDLLEALVLGIVQGLTEFLPVSSSGHLEIVKYIMKDDSLAEQSMLTTVFLHFATALATVVVFKKDILHIIKSFFSPSGQTERSFVLFIVISMIPAAIIGVFFDEIIETLFHKQIVFVGVMLLITGFLLLISERIQSQTKNVGIKESIIIGLAQAVAILPGISRSGATIATALILGVDKSKAARFSFLMVIPLILGKMAKDLLSGDFTQNMPSGMYLTIGFIAAFLTGIAACTWMISIVRKSKLSYFAYYCFTVGILVIIAGQFL